MISVNQHGFMKNRSTVTNLLEYASFVLNSIEEDGWWVPFTRIFRRLLIEYAINCYWRRCLWVRSYLTGRIQRIRTGDAVSKDIRVTSGGVPQGSHCVISDHCVLFGLSTEYRWFPTTSSCCCTPMIWSCFFLSVVCRTV
jgi:hypothetical protein